MEHKLRQRLLRSTTQRQCALFGILDSVLGNNLKKEITKQRAKTELDNWVERYQQYSQLSSYVSHLKLAFQEDKALVKKSVVSSV